MYSLTSKPPITSSEVYQKILNRIITLDLEPGRYISENQMAKEYNVSRSVIRTVFARLSQIGLIEIYPQRGTYISTMDLDFISDILVLRTAVEKEVLYEMFKKLGETERLNLVEKLENNLKEQELCRDEKDYCGKFPELDARFHKIMIDSVGRYALLQVLEDIMFHISRWRSFDVAFDQRVGELIDEHRAIVEGIKIGNLELAQQKMAEHLDTITGIAVKAMEKFPNYFLQKDRNE